jgi:hypothetical protein
VKDLRVLSESWEFLHMVVLAVPTFAFIFIFALLTELSYDELLLNHLNFFVECLKVHIVKLVHMLEKDPG